MNASPGGVQAAEQAVEAWYQHSCALLAAENEEIMQRLRCIEALLLEGESIPRLLTLLGAPLSSHSLPAPSGGMSPPSSYALPTKVYEGEGYGKNGVDTRMEVLRSSSCAVETMSPQTEWRRGGDGLVGYPFKVYGGTPPTVGGLERIPLVPSLSDETLWASPAFAGNGLDVAPEKNGWYPTVPRHRNVVAFSVDPTILSTPVTSTTTRSSTPPSRSLTPLPTFASSGGSLRLLAPSFSSSLVTPYPESSLLPFSTEEDVRHLFDTSQHLEPQILSTPPLFLFRAVVQFKFYRDTFSCSHDGFAPGEYVVVSGDRGKNIGEIVEVYHHNTHSNSFSKSESLSSAREKNSAEHKIVVRKATMSEVEFLLGDQRKAEQEALAFAQIIIQNPVFGLYDSMMLVGAEYQFDRRKLIFYYESTVRPDFRQVVRELYQQFRARIWMEKIKPTE